MACRNCVNVSEGGFVIVMAMSKASSRLFIDEFVYTYKKCGIQKVLFVPYLALSLKFDYFGCKIFWLLKVFFLCKEIIICAISIMNL